MRYLTKSRVKLALECPTKLYYTRKPSEYQDKWLDDKFLRTLAWGGYQVGELAKYYYPGGIEINSRVHETALNETEEYLKKENVILYEPAFSYQNLFIRVDILVKRGDQVQLIEVKAKSFESSDEFTGKRGGINSKWKPYLYDVAFQKYVLTYSHPELNISSHLMLVDKTEEATVEGLNQRFFIARAPGNEIEIIAKNTNDLGKPILTVENVDALVDLIWQEEQELLGDKLSFGSYLSKLSEFYENDQPIWERVRKECRTCQFRLDSPTEDGLKSGIHKCWRKMASLKEEDLDRPLVIDIWDSRRIEDFLLQGRYFQDQLDPGDIGDIKENPPKTGLQKVERQELQILKSKEGDNDYYFDEEGFQEEIRSIKYPLHFIDFETSMVPLPFFKGQRPYEQIAFQFSHHTVDENGIVKHQNEWINQQPGSFPNFQFVRELKKALITNQGTIFRYSNHENTVLCQLHDQLGNSEASDRNELQDWIETITHRSVGSGKNKELLWQGERDMVDQWDLVKRFYYDPATNGSNSLKAILPSAINRSQYLKDIYSQPIYGKDIVSKNFTNHAWLQQDEQGELISPYKQLPEIFEGWTRDELDKRVHPDDELDDGGAAMTAYNMMQFTEMEEKERDRMISALLKYCELDTLAMVMLWQFWMNG